MFHKLILLLCSIVVSRANPLEWNIEIVDSGQKYYEMYTREMSHASASVTLTAEGNEVTGPDGSLYLSLSNRIGIKRGGLIKVRYSALFGRTDAKLYASAVCKTSDGSSCGSHIVSLKSDIHNYLSWISRTVNVHSNYSHVEWELLYKKDDAFNDELSVTVSASESNCRTDKGTCDSLCFVEFCVVKHQLEVVSCQCHRDTNENPPSKEDYTVTGRIVTAAVVIFCVCLVSVCSAYYWRHVRRLNEIETHAENRSDSIPPEHTPQFYQTQEEAGAAADSLILHFPACNSNDTKSCCVCLESSDDTSPDSTLSNDWITTPCSHSMHKDCLRLWLVQRLVKMQHMSCPVCRTVVCF